MAVITIPYSVWLSKYISIEQARRTPQDQLLKYMAVTCTDMSDLGMVRLCEGTVHLDIEDFLTPAQQRELALRDDLALLDEKHQEARKAILTEISQLYSTQAL